MAIPFKKSLSVLKPLYHYVRASYWSYCAKNKGELPAKVHGDGQVVLFVLPEAGIGLNIKTLVMIASQLKHQGIKVYFTRCFKTFSRCLFMDSESLAIEASPQQKKQLCSYCFSSFQKNVVDNGFDFIDIRHFVKEEDKDILNDVIVKKYPDQTFDFTYDDINFSGLLEYNLFLYLKKATLENITTSELKLWQQDLSSLFTAYQSLKRMMQSSGITHVVMYDQYSLNSIIHALTKQLGLHFANITLPFHKDVDPTQIRVMVNDSLSEEIDMINKWDRFVDLSLSPNQVKEITDDLILKMTKRGIFTYSPSKTTSGQLFDELRLDKNRKTIVAYTSSPDEADSIFNTYRKRGLPLQTPEDAFKDQLEWLDDLISFVEKSSNFQLIVRIHPRMAPNHREKWGCPAISDFVEKYSIVYQHVKIIWPQDPVSSFDLAELADVATIAWSTMGIFMARLGVPVVSGIKLSLPLPDEAFHRFCKTKEDYFKTLIDLSHRERDIEHFKNAYRWYHMFFLGYCISLNDIFEGEHRNLAIQSKNAPLVKKALIDHQNTLAMNLSLLQDAQTNTSYSQENIAFQKQLDRLIHFFMTNQDIEINGPMDIQMRDNNIEYHYQGTQYKKYSPLIGNLVVYAQMLKNDKQSQISLNPLKVVSQ